MKKCLSGIQYPGRGIPEFTPFVWIEKSFFKTEIHPLQQLFEVEEEEDIFCETWPDTSCYLI